jgi:hypothetical protein
MVPAVMWIKIEAFRNGTLCRWVSISRRFEGSNAFIFRAKLFLKHSDSNVFFDSFHLQRILGGKFAQKIFFSQTKMKFISPIYLYISQGYTKSSERGL